MQEKHEDGRSNALGNLENKNIEDYYLLESRVVNYQSLLNEFGELKLEQSQNEDEIAAFLNKQAEERSEDFFAIQNSTTETNSDVAVIISNTLANIDAAFEKFKNSLSFDDPQLARLKQETNNAKTNCSKIQGSFSSQSNSPVSPTRREDLGTLADINTRIGESVANLNIDGFFAAIETLNNFFNVIANRTVPNEITDPNQHGRDTRHRG